MKKMMFAACLLAMLQVRAQVGVGTTTANAAAALDIASTTKGVLMPRLTLAQRQAMNPLPAAAPGLLVYQTDGMAGYYYNSSATTTPNWVFLAPVSLPLAISDGGTGGTTAATARTALGAAASGSNTDITSLAPTSAGAINNMVIGGTTPAAAAFTTISAIGSITGITESVNENSTKMASTAFVSRALTNAGGGYTLGDFKLSAQTADHGAWLVCDGRAVSRTTYATLFSLIGTTYGSGNGSTTFNLPDLRGRVPGGMGQGSGLTNRQAGTIAGAEIINLTTGQLPAHTHTATVSTDGAHAHSGNTSTDGNHNHQQGSEALGNYYGGGDYVGDRTYPNSAHAAYRYAYTSTNGAHNHYFSTNTTGSHNHTVTIANTGSGSAVNVMQPTLFAGNYFIYAGQ